jgi:hypothetical protein
MYDTIVDMNTNKQTTPELENFIVLREDQPDKDYYNAIKQAERAERISIAGNRIKDVLAASTRATAHVVGVFMLDAYAGFYDSQNHTTTRQEIRQELGVSWLPRLRTS